MIASDMIAATRRHLLSSSREAVNKLKVNALIGDTSVTFSNALESIRAGAVLSVGLERMYVWSVTEASNSATVQRGWEGTTAAAHTAGDIVRVNSRADDFAILTALNQELTDLSAPDIGLFRVREVDLTYSAATYGYDLAADMIGAPLDVLANYPGLTNSWQRLTLWRFDPSADSTAFPSGKSLTVLDGGYPGYSIRVVYRAPFGQLATLTDDIAAVTYLPATCFDIPPLGAAATLGAERSMRRADVDAQGSARRPEDVTTQDTLIAPRGLLAQRDRRIRSEASRLYAAFPTVMP